MEILLAQDAEHEQVPTTVLVHGHAGFGKTQLVRAYCRTQVTKGVAFRWLDASNVGTIRASFLNFAQEAGLVFQDFESNHHRHDLENSSTLRAIQRALKFIGNLSQSWLLVYDNYDVPEDESFEMRNYFPTGRSGRIIVTSRNRGIATDVGATCLLVGSMGVCESVELLKKSARMSNLGAKPLAQALQKEVATDLLGCHPLAIAQAGGYIRNKIVPRTMQLEEVLLKYKERFLAHEAEMLDGDKASLVKEYGWSVITSWDMSFKTILQQNRTAAEVLLFYGFMHHTGISQDLFAKAYKSMEKMKKQDGIVIANEPYTWLQAILISDEDGQWDSTILEDCLGLLESYSLIRVTNGPSYSMHPLVHAWTRLGKVTSRESLEARAQLALVLQSYMYEKDYDQSPRLAATHMKAISHLESCIRFTQKHTKLLTFSKDPSERKLRPRCLSNPRRLLDGQGLSWELKARQLLTDLCLLAVRNGSIIHGIDDTSTVEAFALLLRLIDIYTDCADIVEQLSQIMLNLVPMITSEKDGYTKAELHFAFLSVRFIALRRTVTRQELADVEMELTTWANSHRHEMDSSYYLSRMASHMSLAVLVIGSDHATRLPRLVHLRDEIEAELGKVSKSAWLTQLAIARCLEEMGKQSEATSIFRHVLEDCKTAESDIRHVWTMATKSLGRGLIKKKSYEELLKLYHSLEERLVKDLGPYHEDTLEAKNQVLYYESELLDGTEASKYPPLLMVQAFYARKEGGLGLDAFIVLTLENVMACKALKKYDRIPSLWQGVIKQARISSSPEALIQKFAWAWEAAAEASDRQGFHYIALVLRTSSDTLKARMLANRAQESKFEQLKRLKSIWDQLALLHEASDASDNVRSCKIAEDIYFEVKCAPKQAQPTIVWLVTQYFSWLYMLEITTLVSPITFRTLGHFQRLASKYFKPDNVTVFQVMGCLALCYRLCGKASPALRIEDYLIEKSTTEVIEQARGSEEQSKGQKIHAPVILERLVNEYRRRKWYPELIRISEIIIKSFTTDLGIAAEETMKKIRFLCEFYGRLELREKIDELLEDMLKHLQRGGQPAKHVLLRQSYSVARWCLYTEQFHTAQRVLCWLVWNGGHLLELSMKRSILGDLEVIARKVEREDLVEENDRLKITLQEQIATMEQSTANETHETDGNG